MATVKKICSCCQKITEITDKQDLPDDMNNIYSNMCSNCATEEILLKHYCQWQGERPPETYNPNQLTLFN